jgi:hypothetical protein
MNPEFRFIEHLSVSATKSRPDCESRSPDLALPFSGEIFFVEILCYLVVCANMKYLVVDIAERLRPSRWFTDGGGPDALAAVTAITTVARLGGPDNAFVRGRLEPQNDEGPRRLDGAGAFEDVGELALSSTVRNLKIS